MDITDAEKSLAVASATLPTSEFKVARAEIPDIVDFLRNWLVSTDDPGEIEALPKTESDWNAFWKEASDDQYTLGEDGDVLEIVGEVADSWLDRTYNYLAFLKKRASNDDDEGNDSGSCNNEPQKRSKTDVADKD